MNFKRTTRVSFRRCICYFKSRVSPDGARLPCRPASAGRAEEVRSPLFGIRLSSPYASCFITTFIVIGYREGYVVVMSSTPCKRQKDTPRLHREEARTHAAYAYLSPPPSNPKKASANGSCDCRVPRSHACCWGNAAGAQQRHFSQKRRRRKEGTFHHDQVTLLNTRRVAGAFTD